MTEETKINELLERLSQQPSDCSQAFPSEEAFRRDFHARLARRKQLGTMVGAFVVAMVISVCLLWMGIIRLEQHPVRNMTAEAMPYAHAKISSYADHHLGGERFPMCLTVISPTGECIECLVFSLSANDFIGFSSKIVTGELFASSLSMTEPNLELNLDIKGSDEQTLHMQEIFPFPAKRMEKKCGKYRITLENLSDSRKHTVTDNTKSSKRIDG